METKRGCSIQKQPRFKTFPYFASLISTSLARAATRIK
jgi:hypothetical protein